MGVIYVITIFYKILILALHLRIERKIKFHEKLELLFKMATQFNIYGHKFSIFNIRTLLNIKKLKITN